MKRKVKITLGVAAFALFLYLIGWPIERIRVTTGVVTLEYEDYYLWARFRPSTMPAPFGSPSMVDIFHRA